MKQILFSLVVMAMVATPFSAFSQEVGILAGMRSNSADLDPQNSGITSSGTNSFFAGAITNYPVSGIVNIRTGFLYTNRGYTLDALGVKEDLNFSYFDIPITALFKATDFGGPFIGVNLGLNVSESCKVSSGSCTLQDVQKVILPFVIGAQFRFMPQLGFEVFYEYLPSKIVKGLKDERAAGAAVLITFD